MVLYLASNDELPIVAWNESAPAFHVVNLDAEHDAVRAQFDLPHVYYAGSHEGCGCGFQLGQYSEPDDAAAKRESLSRLADYLDARIDHDCRVQFFACWSGDESAAPVHRRTVKVSDLRKDSFYFLELEASSFVAA